MERVFFIYNPNAGKGALKNHLSDVLEIFRHAGFDTTVYPTLKPEDATNCVLERGTDYDRIICSGGDGTLHEVVHGLMELKGLREMNSLLSDNSGRQPVCGYIPTGTVNDFATGIRIPKRILNAAEVAASDRHHAYDIGDLNGHYFTYVAAFGAFTSVSYETPQATKNLLGKPAYILEGALQLNTIKSSHVRVDADGEIWDNDCILGMVTNAKSVGGMNLYKRKKILLDDGYFDAIFVKEPKNPIELNLAISFFLTGEESSQIHVMKGKKITIDADTEIAYTLDGENGGTHKKAVITNHKQAITFSVP